MRICLCESSIILISKKSSIINFINVFFLFFADMRSESDEKSDSSILLKLDLRVFFKIKSMNEFVNSDIDIAFLSLSNMQELDVESVCLVCFQCSCLSACSCRFRLVHDI